MADAKSRPSARSAEDASSLADDLQHLTGAEADAARLASGQPLEDGTEATEAEVPAENIAHISDASLPSREEQARALDRAAMQAGGKRK